MKKKHGACGAWQWKEPEKLEWKADTVGKNFKYLSIYFQLFFKLSSSILYIILYIPVTLYPLYVVI